MSQDGIFLYEGKKQVWQEKTEGHVWCGGGSPWAPGPQVVAIDFKLPCMSMYDILPVCAFHKTVITSDHDHVSPQKL